MRRIERIPSIALALILVLDCSLIGPSTSFVTDIVRQSIRPRPSYRSPTRCWGKYSRNTPKKTKIDKDDVLSYERSLVTDRGFSYILGSDETGRGSIAGPLVTVSCCILSLTDNGQIVDPSELPTFGLLPVVKDSKQLSAHERELIYEIVIDNPQIYAISVAQRSNTEIDARGNILTSTMDAFCESIQDLAHEKVFPHSQTANPECYGIVDGKKAPKLTTVNFPCRPMVKADQQVYTVALASIVAKVTLDRMFQAWHEEYSQYNFDQNLGYATKEHIEAIHKHGPCPLHRMTTKSLKGR